MRVVVARSLSRRGDGLGNEIMPWAKGWLASQVLDARLVGPAWGLNRRRYYRHFRTSRADVLLRECLLRLPHHDFDEPAYRATGKIDFGEAVRHWAREKGLLERSSFIVCVDGMWGGWPAVAQARSYILSRLMGSRDAMRNVYRDMSRIDRAKLFVGVHLRYGDGFVPARDGEDVRGKFNISLSPDWYWSVCEKVRAAFDGRVEFRFFCNTTEPSVRQLIAEFSPGHVRRTGLTECSDLLLLSLADLRICSVSSYSMVANFLSDGPYVWYEPQLTLMNGCYSLWGHETAQLAAESLTHSAMRHVRQDLDRTHHHGGRLIFQGYPMSQASPLPEQLVARLESILSTRDWRTNLIYYGCVPTLPAGG